ncbi:hypothetical protein DW954_10825 [Clostridium sp. AM45-5]|nr:hypothetical protein DW954_10825 [Clostridium sp. AM45-5]
MTFHKDCLSAAGTFPDTNAVAVLVDMAVGESFFLKHLKKSRSFLLLMVRRSRDQCQLDLFVDHGILVLFHEL